eukprot:g3820.t1
MELNGKNCSLGLKVVRSKRFEFVKSKDDIYPPENKVGVVTGWTDDKGKQHGDIESEWKGLCKVRWEGSESSSTYRIGFGGEHWLCIEGRKAPTDGFATKVDDTTSCGNEGKKEEVLSEYNVAIGAIVRRSPTFTFVEGDGVYPPKDVLGEVTGWTDGKKGQHGDCHQNYPLLVDVKWNDETPRGCYRMGFAGEFWCYLVSGGTSRPKPKPQMDIFDEACTENRGTCLVTRRFEAEDNKGRVVAFVPTRATSEETALSLDKQIFLRVRQGDVAAVRKILENSPKAIVDSTLVPYTFPNHDAWPYSSLDGCEYGDTPSMIATRFCHSEMLQLCLRSGCSVDEVTNKKGDTLANVARLVLQNTSARSIQPFSDTCGADRIATLLKISDVRAVPPKSLIEGRLIRRPRIECRTCFGTGDDESIRWLLVNGHSDKDQIEYCGAMMKRWDTVLSDRGDSVVARLNCPSKHSFTDELRKLFAASRGGVCGLFVICHGGEDGSWVSFNPADELETFESNDLFKAGLCDSGGPRQLVVVADSCYSALLGKSLYRSLYTRTNQAANGTEKIPSLLFLAASDKPEKNFSVRFALDMMRSRRKLDASTRAALAGSGTNGSGADKTKAMTALEIVEDVRFEGSDDFDPWLFLFVPVENAKTAEEMGHEIYAI